MGTGGADGVPGIFSNSILSVHAQKYGGKDIRTRTAALIDDKIKLDFGPDTFMQSLRDGVDPKSWEAIIFTHSHDDHFAPQELQYCLYPFADADLPPFTIFGNQKIISEMQRRYPDWPFELILTESFVPFSFSDYVFTPISAYHDDGEDCQNILIQRNEITLLYATDTGYWREPTWEFVTDFRFDALVLECSDGLQDNNYEGHLGIHSFLKMTERLNEIGAIDSSTKIVTTHHSCRSNATHRQLETAFCGKNVTVGYDGLVIEVLLRTREPEESNIGSGSS